MKRFLRILKILLVVLLAPILLYFMIAIITSLIPVNKDQIPRTGEVPAFLETNGVHTTIVVPVENEMVNWLNFVDTSHTLSRQADPEYISFGWGDLEFYENTPEWKDLTPETAYKALFKKTPSAMHVHFFKEVTESENNIKIYLDEQQYRQIEVFLKNSFDRNQNGDPKVIPDLRYGNNDAFYEATGSLTLFNTCNTWTNKALKTAGLRACLWTPFDKGIFYQYRSLQE